MGRGYDPAQLPTGQPEQVAPLARIHVHVAASAVEMLVHFMLAERAAQDPAGVRRAWRLRTSSPVAVLAQYVKQRQRVVQFREHPVAMRAIEQLVGFDRGI